MSAPGGGTNANKNANGTANAFEDVNASGNENGNDAVQHRQDAEVDADAHSDATPPSHAGSDATPPSHADSDASTPSHADSVATPPSYADSDATPLSHADQPAHAGFQQMEMAKGPAEAERTVVRKIDWAVLPILFVMYMLAFLDRSNIGNAQVAGMGRDLGISDREFQWLLTIFYIVYACSEGLTVMWLLMPPNVWAFLCALLWGLASALQAAAPKTNHGWEYLMVFRLLLAMAEAGFGPGIPYLLSCFYTRAEIGLRIGIFFSAAPLASSFAGALAYTVTRIPGESWRWLFLVEGLPTLVMAVVAVKWLPGGPNEVRSLSAAQREIVRDRLVDQTGSAQVRERDFIWAEARTALMDPTVWCYTLVSFLACIATTWAADVIRKRGSIVVATSLTGFFGFALLRVLPESLWWRYFSLFFATVGVFSTIPNLLPWILNNQGTDSARATSIVLINFIGQCGPLLGTRLFPADQAPYHMTGILICGLLMLFTSALAAILSYVFMSRNRELERRENLMGVAHLQAGREVERPGVVGYRYML